MDNEQLIEDDNDDDDEEMFRNKYSNELVSIVLATIARVANLCLH